EEHRARDLFYALWVPDLFMERIRINGEWSLFCPNEAPALKDCWGEEFEKLYQQYESEIETETPYMLYKVTALITQTLNKVIDVNYYPVKNAKRSNLQHRPIGIGVQGLADTFNMLGMAFDSIEAQQLNKDIFETIYYHALKASSDLATKEGPYETYSGSPISKGILQPDMWAVTPSNLWDWHAHREMISKN
ncbi:hypothetical protein PIB30_102866, partial [Stylosanthes scabra]|nr:hypothetical protein [Stylosanthes scabra]